MTDKQALAIRSALVGFPDDWIADAIARADEPTSGDTDAMICAAVIATLQAKLAESAATTRQMEERNRAWELALCLGCSDTVH